MKKHLFALSFTLLISFAVSAQVAVNTDGTNPDPSAILDVKSSDKGVLIPRMTESQRDAISNPATGLLIYQINNTSDFYYFNGSVWVPLGGIISLSKPVKVGTGNTNYHLTSLDYTYAIKGEHDVFLPSAVGLSGRIYIIKNLNSNYSPYVKTINGEKIDEDSEIKIGDTTGFITVQSDGSNWIIIGTYAQY